LTPLLRGKLNKMARHPTGAGKSLAAAEILRRRLLTGEDRKMKGVFFRTYETPG